MSKKLYEESSLQGIANAIRTKLGGSDTYLPSEMAGAIENIQIPNLQNKTVTPGASQQIIQPDNGYNGLSSVTINGDANLIAENIKKDIEIFGISGIFEGNGGSDLLIVGSGPPTSDVGSDGQYYLYKEEISTSVSKYGIQIEKAGRDGDSNFTYWGARDIDFVFTDGTDEYHLRNFTDAHCYYSRSYDSTFTQEDSNINGQTNAYQEHEGVPGWYEISAQIPNGYSLSKVRICGRNDGWKDFWRTFKIGQWITRKNFYNILISKSNLVYSDWNTSSQSSYTEFVLQNPIPPLSNEVNHFYQKMVGIWTQFC